MDLLSLESLDERWENQFKKAATRWRTCPRFEKFFIPNQAPHTMEIRSKNIYMPAKARTDRLKNAAVSRAIDLANAEARGSTVNLKPL